MIIWTPVAIPVLYYLERRRMTTSPPSHTHGRRRE